MINDKVFIDSNVKVLRSGICHNEGGEVSYQYVIVDTAEAEEHIGWVADDGNVEFAERLTGWYGSNQGFGNRYFSDPYTLVYGKKLLIVQRSALDI